MSELSNRSTEPLCNNGTMYVILYEFERAMRAFLLYIARCELTKIYNRNWENEFFNRISNTLLKDITKACQREKDIAIYTGMNIDYTKEDFLPFAFILEATVTWWDQLYCDYFKHQQYFNTDIDKIKNVRNAISHFRETTPGAQMETFAICKRLLSIVYTNMPAAEYTSVVKIESLFQPATADVSIDFYGDVYKVYPVRGEAQKDMRVLFDKAISVDAIGISINELTSKLDDRTFFIALQRGMKLNLMFLDPDGINVHIREQEENVGNDVIADITRLNLQRMTRLKDDLEMDGKGNLYDQINIILYDDIPRCNMVFIDNDVLFVQYYANYVKGENNPTFFIKRCTEDGVYDFYRKVFIRTMNRYQKIERKVQ